MKSSSEQVQQRTEKSDIIRDQGKILYYSNSSLGFDPITHFSKSYLHNLPTETGDEWLVLPEYREHYRVNQ